MTAMMSRDQFGRPGAATPIALSAASLMLVITGSVSPSRAGPVWPSLETNAKGTSRLT
jgi:hypothetical protein